MGTHRRTLIRSLLSLPLVGAVARLNLFGSALPIALEYDQDRFEKKDLAIKILRLINTAERWHLCKFGRFASLKRLQELEAAVQFLNDTFEGGGSLFSSLRFDRSQFATGWDSRFRLLANDSGYIVALNSAESGLGAFATDARGLIYQGGLKLAADFDSEWPAARSILVDGSTIDFRGTAPQRFGAFFRTIALGAAPQLFCCGGCCRCDLCCKGGGGKDCTSCCKNCGCQNCSWCAA